AERRDTAEGGRSTRGRWPMAACDARSVNSREVRLEAVQLHVERCNAGRAHHRLARDRRHREDSANRRGAGEQEVLPRGQRPDGEENQDLSGKVEKWKSGKVSEK